MLRPETTSVWLVYIFAGIWNGQTTNTLAENCSSDGALRLVGGSTWREGRVEICLNSVWGTVCDDYWGSLDAQVTCRQLGYPVTGAVPLRSAHFGPGTGPVHIGSASCNGNEQRIVDCQLRYEYNGCVHSEDAGVSCPSPCSPHGGVRLTGSTPGRGTVEIYLNGTWGTVCDNYWNIPNAEVVCRYLGYEGNDAQAYTSAFFGEGYGPVLLGFVNCNGDEASLLNCEHANAAECHHNSDAGVDCIVKRVHMSSVSVIRSPIQQSSSHGANIFTRAKHSSVDTKILQHTSKASSFSTKNYINLLTTVTTSTAGEFIPSSLLTSTQTDGGTSGLYTSSMSTGIRGPDSQGIVTSTQPALMHTETIHTSATTRVVESREPLNLSQLIATLAPSESKKGGFSFASLSERTASLKHTQHLHTSIEIRTSYESSYSTSVQLSTSSTSEQSSSSTSVQLTTPRTSVQQLSSTPSTSPTGWNSKLLISSLMTEMSAAAVVVVFVGILVITVIIAACCRFKKRTHANFRQRYDLSLEVRSHPSEACRFLTDTQAKESDDMDDPPEYDSIYPS